MYSAVSNSTISSYERGDIAPSIDVVIKVAETFNVSTDYLLGLSDSPYPLHSTKVSPYEVRLPFDATKEQYKLIQRIAFEILKSDRASKNDETD